MAEHPILFSGAMVRAILEGRKTQTRRIIKPQPTGRENFPPNQFHTDHWYFRDGYYACPGNDIGTYVRCPHGKVGDRLWVREKHALCPTGTMEGTVLGAYYAADLNDDPAYNWRPSIHMPRGASRLTLEITDVRVQRVQDITEDDARAEGVTIPVSADGCLLIDMTAPVAVFDREEWLRRPARSHFATLWNTLNSKKPGAAWGDNPWAWSLSFRRVEAP